MLAPRSIVVEVASLVPQWGKQNPKVHNGECREALPEFVPPTCNRRVSCEQRRAFGFKRKLAGPAKPQGRTIR